MVRTVFFHLNINVSPKIRLTMKAAVLQLHLCICRQQIACLACNQLHKRARSNPEQHLTLIITILLSHSLTLPERCAVTPAEMQMTANQHPACTHDMQCSYTHPRKENYSQNFRTLFFHTNTFVNTMDDASWQVESKEALSYIKFSQQGLRSTWFRIDRLTVYESFCIAAMDMENMPLLPEGGLGATSPYGPWFAYVPEWSVDIFLDEQQYLKVELTSDKGEKIPIALAATRPDAPDQSGSGSRPEKFRVQTKLLAKVHVTMFIPQGPLFTSITRSSVVSFWESRGFIVFSAHRGGVVKDGKRLKGIEYQTEEFHADLRPRQGNILGAIFPLCVKITVGQTPVDLKYRIDERCEALNGRICTNYCHRYFRHVIEQFRLSPLEYEPCVCSDRPQAPPRAHRVTAKERGDAFLRELASRKGLTIGGDCKHYTAGKCASAVRGKTCKFAHDVPPNSILCEHPRRKGTSDCVFGSRCLYGQPPQAAPASQAETDAGSTHGDQVSLVGLPGSSGDADQHMIDGAPT